MFPTKRKRFCLTELVATIGIGPPLPGAFTGFLLPCCPLFRQGLRNNASASRHLDGAFEGADGPLVHHGTIYVPGLANVQQSYKLKLARICCASSLTGGKELVPVGHGDSDLDAIQPFELSPIARTGELFDGVVDDCHGWSLKRGASPLMRELYSTTKQGLSALLLHGNILLQRSVPMVAVELFSVPDAHGAVELAVPQPFFTIAALLNAEALDGSLH